ncbi:hypothetical protein BP5796_10802 [Coleophoma crateriformis]|uniref:Heme haloperoxidase family profile domain-containing protein n=1 Tax=Coleophoma crateriformis TaxID=565419 RepID=A0A3D8QLG2_9HELO|nr:hypothetical protein BP5796_10802 [Coleophoma crateriformis]
MKFTNCVSLFVLSEAVSQVAAFPALKENVDLNAVVPLNAFKRSTNNAGDAVNVGSHNIPIEYLKTLLNESLAKTTPAEALLKKRTTFDPVTQLIDVHGDHEFMLPDYAAGDVRGPCPGLNTLANHNYLPRNGYATITQYIEATNKVWGMGREISLILATYGTLLGGNVVSLNPGVSMGGKSNAAGSKNLLDNLGGLLGQPRGLSGTHNSFEVDGSNTRNDLYDPMGNNNDLNLTYFTEIYNSQKDAEVPNYSMDVMFDYAEKRFYQDIAYNPNFIYLPWSGWFVRNAAIIFSGRLFVNCSEEYPEGILGKEGFKSIYGVSGPDDNLTYTSGADRIPENYYRRADDLTLPEGFLELVAQTVVKHPVLFSIGGNTNGVNTFTGIDYANITGGAFNAADLLEGNNLLCFAFQALKEGSPNLLSSLYATIAPILSEVTSLADSVMLSLNCPAYKDLSVDGVDLFSYIKATYPGASMSNGAI